MACLIALPADGLARCHLSWESVAPRRRCRSVAQNPWLRRSPFGEGPLFDANKPMTNEVLSDDDVGRLKEALHHEELAARLYREYARDADDERLKEMFDQFAMNESWHAAALRSKLQKTQS